MLKRMIAGATASLILALSPVAVATDGNHGACPSALEAESVQIDVISTNPEDYPLPVMDRELGIQAGESVEDDYFDDVVFVGDSISLKLCYYVKKQRQTDTDFLGKARFLVAGSLGSGNALWEISTESVHPSYQGQKMLIEDSIKKMNAQKVYIMLGINDVSLYGLDGSIENMRTLIGRILEKSPDVQIYVQSATPRIAAMTSRPTNRMIFDYDLKLYELCVSEGWHYVDVASVMRDENGNLYDEYCSDAPTMGMHFTDKACQIWVDYLKTHAQSGEVEEI